MVINLKKNVFQNYQQHDEQYHQKLKHSYNFDKTKTKKQVFVYKNYIFGFRMQEAIFQVNTVKEAPKTHIKMMFRIW